MGLRAGKLANWQSGKVGGKRKLEQWRRQHCLMKIYAAALICVNNARQQRHRIPSHTLAHSWPHLNHLVGHGANDLDEQLQGL